MLSQVDPALITPLHINGKTLTESKSLGVHITDDLTWTLNSTSVSSLPAILTTFYKGDNRELPNLLC